MSEKSETGTYRGTFIRTMKWAWNEGGYERTRLIAIILATIGLIGAIIDTVVL